MRVALARVNALPMFHIRGGGLEQGGVVAEVAEPSVACRTKQGSQHVGLVAMIDRQFLVGLFSADRTEAVLPRRHRVEVRSLAKAVDDATPQAAAGRPHIEAGGAR